jgi:predicted LPLAT superfamily acyltransferase
MAILSFLESTLSAFRLCFSRTAAYRWFVVVICGLMVRTDHLGVTSIIRALSLCEKKYECIINFFRSTAYSLKELRNVWYSVVLKSGTLYQLNNRNLLIGDGTKD